MVYFIQQRSFDTAIGRQYTGSENTPARKLRVRNYFHELQNHAALGSMISTLPKAIVVC